MAGRDVVPSVKKPRWRKALLAGALALVAVDAVRVLLWKPRPVEGPAPADGWARVAGVVHVHTTLSDGGGTPEQVIAAAQRAGLDFLAITDHNNLDAKPHEGQHGRTLVVVGTEVSTVSGHVLGLGLSPPVFQFSRDPHDSLVDIRDLGGTAFVAHPDNPRQDLRWQAWDEPGPWGMEVWNADSQWRQASWPARARALGTYALNRGYGLLSTLSRPAAALQRWDALLARRPAPGIAGTDAHGGVELSEKRRLPVPAYEPLFALARNHVLLERAPSGRFEPDSRALLEALAHGRSYLGLDALAPAGGFFFVAEADGRRWTMGDTVPATAAARLRAGGRLPRGTKLKLLRDGKPLAEAVGAVDLAVPGPGVYRVEAYVPGWSAPWIISNPIAVFDEAATAARTRQAGWPAEPAPPPPAQVIADFDREMPFDPGSDPRSHIETPVLDAQGGVKGGAARMAFYLGQPDDQHPDVFCALMNRRHRDLRGRQGLVFALRGDGAYRMWVQVRDANPAVPDEGTEWWFASVKTATEWRRLQVPFDRLRSIQKGTDGRLDLDKVRAIVFVIDKGAVKPGTSGTIWIDELGVY